MVEHKNGFAFVVVVTMISAMSFLSLGWWRRTSMAYETVLARERWYKSFYATDVGLQRGIEHVKKIYLQSKRPKKLKLDMSFVLKKKFFVVEDGLLFFEAFFGSSGEEGALLSSTLYCGGKKVCCTKCLFRVDKRHVFEKRFVIESYTVSNFV